jgi:hypothetical protein
MNYSTAVLCLIKFRITSHPSICVKEEVPVVLRSFAMLCGGRPTSKDVDLASQMFFCVLSFGCDFYYNVSEDGFG